MTNQEDPNGSAILDRLCFLIRRYLILPEHAAEVLALWAFSTWVFHLEDWWRRLDYFPMLALSSPTPRCGKSRTQRILDVAVHKPKRSVGHTESTLFRTIAASKPTLLIDEFDTTLGTAKERVAAIQGVLDAAFENGLKVPRTERRGKEWVILEFDVFGPVCFSTIDRLIPTIRDRSIIIRMRRKKADEGVARFRRAEKLEFEAVRMEILVWWKLHVEDVLSRYERGIDAPSELDDRAADLWEVLFAVADACGDTWPALARSAAVGLSGNRDADPEDSNAVDLLNDLRDILNGSSEISTVDLIEALCKLEDRPWATWNNKRDRINAHQIAGLLKSFGVRSRKVYVGAAKGYAAESLKDAFDRYLASTPLPSVRPSESVQMAPGGHSLGRTDDSEMPMS